MLNWVISKLYDPAGNSLVRLRHLPLTESCEYYRFYFNSEDAQGSVNCGCNHSRVTLT